MQSRAAIPNLLFLFVSIQVGTCMAENVPLTTKPAPLEKIVIARDGRTFITQSGVPFVPMGVNYYRPGTGWAPQVWKKFDPEATRKDFALMKQMGVNCVRVFTTFGSFFRDPAGLMTDGLDKFDQFLAIAEQAGIYVHPTGPDHWEGMPNWSPVAVEDEKTVAALETFWKLFAAQYRGRSVIFAYDLRNEPEVGWNNVGLSNRWNIWLEKKYGTTARAQKAWDRTNHLAFGSIPPPPNEVAAKDPLMLDYQSFREELADDWTRRQAAAIKSSDHRALVTVGLIQWSVPVQLPAGPRHYAAFRPERQAKFLDFLEVHFYPLTRGAFEYRTEEDELANLAYLESVVREVARPGKPVVLAEFGWYGGGKPKFDRGSHPEASEMQHANYCRAVVESSTGFATGWLNWGFFDQPEATDCSELTGLMKPDGTPKAWGTTFQELSARYTKKPVPPATIGVRPELDWDACVTSSQAGNEYRQKYFEAFLADRAAKK